ncbi:hypothetical protein [Baekduia sp. Peel2402]|uniref:hypothetical protein n=1 Tax=Baekduia sp. Peel2402 TaxID=3458296 RepID=UPI00403EF258
MTKRSSARKPSYWPSDRLREWLPPTRSKVGKYTHTLLDEHIPSRDDGLRELAQLVREVHRVQREALEAVFQRSLDPLDPTAVADPDVVVYPDDLDTITLQGYLGEFLAGLVAENHSPHGGPWTVPAFLFSDHSAAMQSLERRRQLGGSPRAAPGRTGDDILAFRVDGDGHISAWLFGEAKCSTKHFSSLVADGHAQFEAGIYVPVDLVVLVKILRDRAGEGDLEWADALSELFLKDAASAPERMDMLVYVCGKKPTAKKTWMSVTAPHDKYAGGKRLEAVEVHISDVDGVLRAVHPAHVIARPKSRLKTGTTKRAS